ncbi:MAG: hypothetical protein ABI867_24490 [Kofleriaceae bacterium]
MGEQRDSREQVLLDVQATAKAVFQAQPATRSLLFAVAQYWNDQADDEVHSHLVASERETPVWPHVCAEYDESGNAVPGERCSNCAYEELRSPWVSVGPWEPYCHEHGSQDQDYAASYLPYAIVRRGTGDDVNVERVGRLQRPHAELVDAPDVIETPAAWTDPRTRALYDEVCAHPLDDGPRAVLSDYLLQAHPGDPRGELLALALAPQLDAETAARRDALLAAHERSWLGAAGGVIPLGCARFERGFLATAEVFASDSSTCDRVRGHHAWGTLQTLRHLPGSAELLDPAMVALRDTGPIASEAIAVLAAATRPWAIERLHVIATDADVDVLAAVTTLPRLRTLVLEAGIGGDFGESQPDDVQVIDAMLARLTAAAWWSQLHELVVVIDSLAESAARRNRFALTAAKPKRSAEPQLRPIDLQPWFERHARLRGPALSICDACDDVGGPAGWQVTFRGGDTVDVTMVGWHPTATLGTLIALVQTLPAEVSTVRLVDSPLRVATAHDVDFVAAATERTITLA